MYDAPTTRRAAAEQSSYSRAELGRLVSRLEAVHGESSEVFGAALIGAAIVDAVRELTYTLDGVVAAPDGLAEALAAAAERVVTATTGDNGGGQ